MKKIKEESPIKAARKKAREAIEIRLNNLLKTITTELGQEAINFEKESKKLAKKIIKGVKAANKTADKELSPAKTPEKQKINSINAKAVIKPQPVSVKKTAAKPIIAKKVAPKTVAVKTSKKTAEK